VTLKLPAPPVTVPRELVPSPQLIVAVKSPAELILLLSVNVATVGSGEGTTDQAVPVKLVAVAVKSPSSTVTLVLNVMGEPILGVTVTTTLYVPSSAKV
jgi:hypothetical protein